MPVSPMNATPVDAVELVRDYLRAWERLDAEQGVEAFAELARRVHDVVNTDPERAALYVTGLASLNVAFLRAMAGGVYSPEDLLDSVALGVMGAGR